jgi:hypothetical protein
MMDDFQRSRLERELERQEWQVRRCACQAYRDEQRRRWDQSSRRIDDTNARAQAWLDALKQRLAEDDDKATIH